MFVLFGKKLNKGDNKCDSKRCVHNCVFFMKVIDSVHLACSILQVLRYLVPGLCFICKNISVFWNCKCYPVVGTSWCTFLMFPLESDISGPAAWEVNDSIGVRAPGLPPVQFPLLGITTP